MRRRHLLQIGVAAPGSLLLAGCQGELPRFVSWRSAQDAVLELLFKQHLLDNRWSLPQLLQHLAQSIEYSMQGYPELKPAWFRASLGKTAFTFFNARGAMTHTLDEPIPGAPALEAQQALKTSVQRLLDAMQAFAAYKGELKPHFAYGSLTRAEYQRAHLMHLANHWSQIQPASALAATITNNPKETSA
jgi:hypothetical protein